MSLFVTCFSEVDEKTSPVGVRFEVKWNLNNVEMFLSNHETCHLKNLQIYVIARIYGKFSNLLNILFAYESNNFLTYSTFARIKIILYKILPLLAGGCLELHRGKTKEMDWRRGWGWSWKISLKNICIKKFFIPVPNKLFDPSWHLSNVPNLNSGTRLGNFSHTSDDERYFHKNWWHKRRLAYRWYHFRDGNVLNVFLMLKKNADNIVLKYLWYDRIRFVIEWARCGNLWGYFNNYRNFSKISTRGPIRII